MTDEVFGVIDVGSNTVHLLVAASDGTDVRRLDDVSVFLRLGADLELTGGITPPKVRDVAICALELAQRAELLGAHDVRLLATQAVRAASNRDEVVRAIEAMTGLPVSVLDPEREAYFAVLGAALTRSFGEHHLVVDVGGASTQISIASGETLLAMRSVPIGSGRLASRLKNDPPGRSEIRKISERVRREIEPAVEALFRRERAATGAVVVGGAPRRVARIIQSSGAPVLVTRESLRTALSVLLRRPAKEIASPKGIELDRVPMARAGGIILQQVLEAAGLDDCTISPYGIREGAVLDAARTAPWQIAFAREEKTVHGQPAAARR